MLLPVVSGIVPIELVNALQTVPHLFPFPFVHVPSESMPVLFESPFLLAIEWLIPFVLMLSFDAYSVPPTFHLQSAVVVMPAVAIGMYSDPFWPSP